MRADNTELSQNYFELFGLPINYNIDLAKLSETYRELQKTVHPDRFANGTDREKLLSAQKATVVNEAYSCLKFPIKRAQYLLEINNIKYDDERETIQNPEFLMEENEYLQKLQRALANLSEAQRSAFLMNRIEGKKHKEIAAILEISTKAVEKRIYGALKKLREEIEGI